MNPHTTDSDALVPGSLRTCFRGVFLGLAPAPPRHPIDVAEVDLDRNTKVVDATANWVNVTSEPGFVMAGADAAPPLHRAT